jgi:hypothetical protein
VADPKLSLARTENPVFTVEIAKAILNSLGDYTTDQRGDVGSLVRAEAILAVHTAWKCGLLTNSNEHRSLIGLICGLAVEKLDKIRHLAWACLYDLWPSIVKAPLPIRFVLLQCLYDCRLNLCIVLNISM